VADTSENRANFRLPGASRGESAFPQLRFVTLLENGTHVLFGARLGCFADSETMLAHGVLAALRPGMLCLADRQFFGYALWQAACAIGADLLWRGKHNLRLPRETVLADGSYLTTIFPCDKDRRHGANGVQLRVVEYRLEGVTDAEPLYMIADHDSWTRSRHPPKPVGRPFHSAHALGAAARARFDELKAASARGADRAAQQDR